MRRSSQILDKPLQCMGIITIIMAVGKVEVSSAVN
jgi:hypothetical protein